MPIYVRQKGKQQLQKIEDIEQIISLNPIVLANSNSSVFLNGANDNALQVLDLHNTKIQYVYVAPEEGAPYKVFGPTKQAYVIYSYTDDSLTFYYNDSMPTEGYYYNGKAVTIIYDDFIDTEYTELDLPPWNDIRSDIKLVYFDDSFAAARPVYTAYWFYNMSNLTNINDIKNLNTSEVVDMHDMFSGLPNLTELDVSGFGVRKVKTMYGMFYNCGFLTLDVSNWRTDSLIDAHGVFDSCGNLESIIGLTNLDMSHCIDLNRFLYNCKSLKTCDVSNFNTANVQDMNAMFQSDSSLTTIYSNDNNFVVSGLNTIPSGMFTNCSKLVGGAGTTYSSSKTDSSMAHVDTADNPGYFTDIKAFIKNYTLDEVMDIIDAGEAENYFSIGDVTEPIELNGTVGAYTFDHESYRAVVIGFDHNMGIETNFCHSMTLQFGQNEDGVNIAFIDSSYNSIGSTDAFRMNTSNTNSGGWESSYMRNTICPEFLEAMPTDWQGVIGTTTKYTDNVGGGNGNIESNVTATEDKIFLLNDYEANDPYYANTYESNYTTAYSDMYSSNSDRIRYRHSAPSSSSSWWLRSPYRDNSNNFCYVTTNGGSNAYAYDSYGFAPAFNLIGKNRI